MVSSVARSSRLSLLLAILCIAVSIVRAADINGICQKTLNPPLCLKLLNSIPGAAGLDLKTLGKTAINNAIANATGTQNLIKSLLSKTTDPQLKKNLDQCSSSFGAAVDTLQESQADFGAADYFGANIQVSAAETNADDCNDAIGSSVPSLSTNIQNVEIYCSAILVICNTLRGSIFQFS